MADERDTPADAPRPLIETLEAARTNRDRSLLTLSREPLLVVFLRHLGCSFCREALADLAERRADIEAAGARIVLVHQGPPDEAAMLFARYGLGDVDHVTDADRDLYRALGLRRGTMRQLLGPSVWWRGFTALLHGHRPGRLRGNGLQMPGAFLISDGQLVRAFRHETAADRPDYCALAAG